MDASQSGAKSLKSHVLHAYMACGRWFGDYMRVIRLSERDPPEVWQEYLRRQAEAYSALVEVCTRYLEERGEEPADVICRNYTIYELLHICEEALGER
jgi:hypothetical protein